MIGSDTPVSRPRLTICLTLCLIFFYPCKVEMTLEGNALTGSLPQLSGLLRVRKLNFGSNFFTSTIPSGSADDVILDDLRELTMRDNLLTGHIPTELGLAPRLRKFILFHISSDCNYVGYILTLMSVALVV